MESVHTEIYNGHRISTALHDTGSKKIVIFCHGYRSSTIGPNRFFVLAARQLAKQGISSLRFDQYGSGNSEGDFFESSFDDWVETATAIANHYLESGYQVGLFGQSMGGSTVICVGSSIQKLTAIVSWVPDASADTFTPPESGFFEEAGQRVQSSFWQEAHDISVAQRLRDVQAPTYIVQCSKDEYVSAQNHNAIKQNAQDHHTVVMYDGYPHSSWSYEQAAAIINKSVDFLVGSFK